MMKNNLSVLLLNYNVDKPKYQKLSDTNLSHLYIYIAQVVSGQLLTLKSSTGTVSTFGLSIFFSQ